MEDISTPSRAATPWIANLATLAVVIAAIGWSSEQRPTAQLAHAPTATPASTQAQSRADNVLVTPTSAAETRSPVMTTSFQADGLQIVSLQTSRLR